MSVAPTQLIALVAQAGAPLSAMGILALCFLGAVGVGLALPHNRSLMTKRGGFALAAAAGLIFGVLLLRWGAGATDGGSVSPYFWAFAAISIVAAIRVITHPKPVYSALYFVMTVFSSAGLFVLLNAQFMAAAIVLIYAGAVLVTYTFVIMLAAESTGGTGTNEVTNGSSVDAVARDPFVAGAIGFTLMAVLLMAVFDEQSMTAVARDAGVSGPRPGMSGVLQTSTSFEETPPVAGDTQLLGRTLYTDHIVSIQAAMLILTLAMTGAVIIARRRVYVSTPVSAKADTVVTPSTPNDDNPHTIPIYGTDNPRAKEYPQT